MKKESDISLIVAILVAMLIVMIVKKNKRARVVERIERNIQRP